MSARTRRAIALGKNLRFLVYAFGLAYVLILWVNIAVPYVNQAPAPEGFNWSFAYPPSTPDTIQVGNANKTLTFQILIQASAPYADGSEVQIAGSGCMGHDLNGEISDVEVGFDGAYFWPLDATATTTGPFGGIDLSQYYPGIPGDNHPLFCLKDGIAINGTPANITFRSARDYPLTIHILFVNQSAKDYTYQDLVVPVVSSHDLSQGRINQGIYAITFVGFLFVVMDVIPKWRAAQK